MAHGFSYHNGPEWVWVYGYFLKAMVAIYGKEELTPNRFYSFLLNHKKCIHENEW
jgi:glycogen debranching enzyme